MKRLILLLCAGLSTFHVNAQTRWLNEEYSELIKKAESVQAVGTNLFGDSTNLQNGQTEFAVTDIEIPGLGPSVSVGRRYEIGPRSHTKADFAFGDWDLDMPFLQGTYAQATGWQVTSAQPDNRCSPATKAQAAPPARTGVNGEPFAPERYWYGSKLHLPGGDQELLYVRPETPRPTTAYFWTTKSNWVFSCTPLQAGGTGEGFVALAPDGTRYVFDWMVRLSLPGIKGPYQGQTITNLAREDIRIYPTRIEDRFGNSVTYTYRAVGSHLLSTIQASDGRGLTLNYEDGQSRVTSITTAGDTPRTWRYEYTGTLQTGNFLNKVVLPDNSAWQYALSQIFSLPFPNSILYNLCNPPPITNNNPKTATITHPTGAVGTFVFHRTRHGRTYVPGYCSVPGAYMESLEGGEVDYPPTYDVASIIQKKITGPGIPTSQWDFSYTPNWQSNGDTTNETTVVAPDGSSTVYSHGNKFNESDGQLLRVDLWSGGTLVKRTDTAYLSDVSGQPFPASIGYNLQERQDPLSAEGQRPQRSSTITQDGATFSSLVNSYDGFARSRSVTKSSSLGYSKTDIVIHHENLSKWVLGQPLSTSIDGSVVSEATYDPLTVLPLTQKAFGKLQHTLTYNTDGTLATVKDGNNHITTLSNWKRGIPQLIQHPATPDQPGGTAESAVVNDNGWITAINDENGYRTCYTYDLMGRLSSSTPPSETTPSTCDTTQTHWNRTALSFMPDGPAVYGLAANHWQQVVSTGNARKIIHFDALWRPVVEETYDNANIADTRSLTVKRYDADGHLAFQSSPLATLSDYASPALTGIRTEYDALDRATAVRQDSELGVLSTTTEYLPGFQTKVKSPRGQSTGAATVTAYMAYDQPTMDWPVSITHPAGAYTSIGRDVFGKPVHLVRRNADSTEWKAHWFAYDAYQRLCHRSDVETGTTAMGYDDAGNLLWSAAGLSWSPAGPCYEGTAAHVAARRVDRTYDARNRLKTLTFPNDPVTGDGNGNQTWSYTKDSLPEQVSTWNVPALGAPAKETRNLYVYNARRLPTTETLAVPAWYTYAIGYEYDANASLRKQFYPSGRSVDFAPNALGQPTQAKDLATGGANYASGVSYYPNGALKQFTYGNNIVHAMTQTPVRQLPATSTDGTAMGLAYAFDANGNVSAITDTAQANHNRTMQYDDLDRLTQVTSPMFGADPVATYAYNTLDNLTRVKTNGRDTYYCYNANNALDFVRTGPDCATSPAATTLSYDGQGNLSVKNAQAFKFDVGNRLREVTSGGTALERYRYDAHGRRVIASRLSGPADTIGVIFSDYASNGQLLYQQNLRSAVNKDIDSIYLAGSLVAQREVPVGGGTAVVKYQHTDALGSPVAVTNSAGAVIERMDYEAYGQRIAGTMGGPPKDGPGYTGHVLDLATSMNYMQQRYYDSGIGRFLSVDPVTADGNTGGNFNRYWYADNNPYKFTDPDGRRIRRVGGHEQKPGDLTGERYVGWSISGMNVNSATFQALIVASNSSTSNTDGNVAVGSVSEVVDPKPTNPESNAAPSNPVKPCACTSYSDRYMAHLDQYLINVGPYAAVLAGGLWPKSFAPATGGRGPLLGSSNPLTSVPRAVGVPGAGSVAVRTGAAGVGLATVGIGFYNVGTFAAGVFYAIPSYCNCELDSGGGP